MRPPLGLPAAARLVDRLLARVLLGAVRVYQLLVSPLLGPTCRYYPSCSAYSVQALRLHGGLAGSWLTVRRLLRCHPWSPGGVDHVPPTRRQLDTRSPHPAQSRSTSPTPAA